MFAGSTVTTRNSTVKRLRNISMTFGSTPLLSLRKTAWKSSIREFEWFLSGSSNINDLHTSVQKWWTPWANKLGIIANNYSKQFKHFKGEDGKPFDQIQYLIDALTNNPYSRRTIATTWNTSDMCNPYTPITNCHGTIIQCFVEPGDNTLHMTMYQRSADVLLGLQHNLIQYWALLMYLAHRSGREVGSFTWVGGDNHIYDCHFGAAGRMCSERVDNIVTPELIYTPTSDEFLAVDFSIKGEYKPLNTESLPMVV